MTKRKTILYALAMLAYVVFSFTMFPHWKVNVIIPFIPLIALGGWLFGTTIGLTLIIPAILYHAILMSFVYADLLIYFQAKGTGVVIITICVLLAGHLRKGLDAIKATNLKLDRMVAERNSQLDQLACQLIENSEHARISLGETLHDGIGQQMAGIQLFCASLADRLHATGNSKAAQADTLVTEISITHNQIRRIARMLFPIRIGQVGLIPALNELTACFRELENVHFSAQASENLPGLPENTALQLYRICQETSIHAIRELKADHININVLATHNFLKLEFSHNGSPLRFDSENHSLRLIEYRLRQTSGTTSDSFSLQGLEKTVFTFPNPTRAVPG